MNEKLRKGLVFGSLVLALIWLYFTYSDRGPKGERLPQRPMATVVDTSEPATVVEVEPVADSLYASYNSKPWGKNPFYHNFRPPVDPEGPSKAEFHLMGVMFREMNAQALIDNRIVSVGDNMKGYRVTEIARDSVVLDNGEKTLVLRIQKEKS